MEVELLSYTDDPEEVIATAARNDYYGDWVGDDSFEEVMDGVSYDERDYERAREKLMDEAEDWDLYDESDVELEAKKYSLIEQLLDREHYGPLEHAHASFEVKGISRVTMAQITRHRHLSFDVQSMRYVDFEDKEAVTPPTIDTSEDPHLSREKGLVDLDEETQEEFGERYDELVDDIFEFYQDAVDAGVPKEDARYALPLGTPVNVVFSGNLRSLAHVLNMRGKADAQHEIRELTEEVSQEIEEIAPITAEYFEENGPFKLGL